MIPFIKKDILLLIRDKKELAILLLMPFILIAILGFALGGFMNNMAPELDMTVILVDQDDETAGAEQFAEEVRERSLPDEASAQLLAAADQLNPYQLLMNVLESEELSKVLELKEMDEQAAKAALEKDEANAILTLPENFTYNTLNKMLLDQGEGAALHLQLSEASLLKAGVFHDIVKSFTKSVNFQTALNQTFGSRTESGEMLSEIPEVTGDVISVSQLEAVTSMQYYTFGMIVMFVLFVAASVSGGAYWEKKHFTYDRILLAGADPLRFLGGKAVSAALLVVLQMAVLIGLSGLIFQIFSGKPASIWPGIVIVGAVLAISIGALSALLTALNIRFQSENATNVFASMLVTLFAFFGGSFFPISQMSDTISAIGEWTPNGAALSSFLQVLQGTETDRWMVNVYRLLVTSALLMVISIWVFPRRRLS